MLASPFLQFLLVSGVLVIVTLASRFSEKAVISTGAYMCLSWIAVCTMFSLFMDLYWLYLFHWFLAMLGFLLIYFLLIYLCGRFGNPYNGDGGLLMLLPVYIYPVALVGSLFFKGLTELVKWIS